MRRTEQVAMQLRALLDRHQLTPRDLELRTVRDGRVPISSITIRRILKAEARTEPEPDTLRRIAEAVGENYLVAFAHDEHDGIVTVEITRRDDRFDLQLAGATAPPGLEAELRKVLDRYGRKPRVKAAR